MKEKSAQDFMESMRRGVSQVPGMASQAGGSIKNWYQNLNPEARNAVIRGLMGAGIGAGVTGGLAALSPHDPEEKRPVMGPALLGALMGGTAGAGIPYGLKLLSNKVQFPGEKSRPVGASLVDRLAGSIVSNPGKAIGGAAGGYTLYNTLGQQLNPETKKYESSPAKDAWKASRYATPPLIDAVPPVQGSLGADIKDLGSSSSALRSIARGNIGQRAQSIPPRVINSKAINLVRRALLTVKNTPANRGKLGLLALPGGLAAGAILDKYLKGDY